MTDFLADFSTSLTPEQAARSGVHVAALFLAAWRLLARPIRGAKSVPAEHHCDTHETLCAALVQIERDDAMLRELRSALAAIELRAMLAAETARDGQRRSLLLRVGPGHMAKIDGDIEPPWKALAAINAAARKALDTADAMDRASTAGVSPASPNLSESTKNGGRAK